MRVVPRPVWSAGLRGVVSTVEKEGALWGLRHPPALLEALTPQPELFASAFASAGVRLVFRSDTSKLRIRGRLIPGVEGVPATIDVIVDGNLHHPWRWDARPGPWAIELGLPHVRERRFEIYLSHAHALGLTSVEVREGSALEPYQTLGPRLWFMGDAVAQGLESHHPALTYAAEAARRAGLDFINAGVSGTVAGQLPALPPMTPLERIFVGFGSQDWESGQDPQGILTVARTLECRGAPVAIVEPPPWPEREGLENGRGRTLDAFRNVLRSWEDGPHRRVVKSALHLSRDPERYCGSHPTEDGQVTLGAAAASLLGRSGRRPTSILGNAVLRPAG
ncbi:MAG: hypothetical protein AAFU79_14480 [Myxococcota bacterium]